MKKLTLSFCLIVATMNIYGSVKCERDFPGYHSDFNVLRTSKDKSFLLNNWENIPVIRDFDRKYCESAIEMELVKVKREFFWVFTSNDDTCDGGNTYGVVYDYKLNNPVAAVSDGDIECF